uniref:NADH dehydrogenase subunit 4L n=1 Tax=Elthusa poutassouiensis TaxID=3104314 RepID=UPI002E7613EC|nr:NADH dehydrogenase subunit 4L [Elthusa poutassouiensis]WPS93554.1 NADH dehydrogenase subunit 4L [Elthusa poutassouiensis]
MINMKYMIGMVLFSSGLVMFVMNWDHLIMSLLYLEVMVLSLYFLFSMGSGSVGNSFGVLFFISLAVCEGCLGLGIFISLVSSEGDDKMDLMGYLEW